MTSRYITYLWLAIVVCWCVLALETKGGQGAAGHPPLPHHHTPAENDAFEGYKNVHKKKYKSQDDHDHRKQKFVHNHRKILAHNAKHSKGEVKFKLAHNDYSDLNTTEFVAKLTGFRKPSSASRRAYERSHPTSLRAATNLPVSVDWRSKGYVTTIKNQGQCGSCFTFSALGALEGAVFKKTGRLTALSEQMLVDCMYPPRGGCSGGWMHDAWDFINSKKGVPTDKNYAYTAEVSGCKTKTQQAVSKITTHYVTAGNEQALKEALATVGPISVAVDAGSEAFQLYHSGVYFEDTCSADSINHAVLAVGYGVDEWSGFETWTIKNSWGTSWGENGYMYLARNMNNMCGVASYAVYPTLA